MVLLFLLGMACVSAPFGHPEDSVERTMEGEGMSPESGGGAATAVVDEAKASDGGEGQYVDLLDVGSGKKGKRMDIGGGKQVEVVESGGGEQSGRRGDVDWVIAPEDRTEQPSGGVGRIPEAATGEIDPDDPLLTLVNPTHPLPEDWQVELVDIGGGRQIDIRAYDGLMAMLAGCEQAGYSPMVCSAYRTYEKQLSLYENKLRRCRAEGLSDAEAEREAAFWVARPNTSEHQLGLAVDIVTWENQRLDDSQLDSPAQQWLMAHCWEYGFLFRYQADKTEYTQVGHEPWHYRYVGLNAALAIRDSGMCLEEFLGALEAKKGG